jgi:hypothetical protein
MMLGLALEAILNIELHYESGEVERNLCFQGQQIYNEYEMI